MSLRLRPPLAQDRLQVIGEGEIWLTLRHRWADGTTHLRFDPLELLERLAVLTPRPRVNLILYYGVLAPRAAWRAALVPATSPGVETSQLEPSVEWAGDRTASQLAVAISNRSPGSATLLMRLLIPISHRHLPAARSSRAKRSVSRKSPVVSQY